MGSSGTSGAGRDGWSGRVLSGGPRAEGPNGQDLGPPAFRWEPEPLHPAIGTGIFLPAGAIRTSDAGYRMEVGEAEPFRCTPILVAYPRGGSAPNVYYAVLGGRVHLSLDGTLSPANDGDFQPEPDLVFTLGVELPAEMARRLGHSAAATSVFRGAPGNCGRPRLLSLVGSRPRLALSQLGHHLLQQKGFPSCAAPAEH